MVEPAHFSVRYSEERPESPESGRAEKDHEGYTGEAPRSGSSAPRLEHGDDSNKENQDRACAKSFQPHGCLPCSAKCAEENCGKEERTHSSRELFFA